MDEEVRAFFFPELAKPWGLSQSRVGVVWVTVGLNPEDAIVSWEVGSSVWMVSIFLDESWLRSARAPVNIPCSSHKLGLGTSADSPQNHLLLAFWHSVFGAQTPRSQCLTQMNLSAQEIRPKVFGGADVLMQREAWRVGRPTFPSESENGSYGRRSFDWCGAWWDAWSQHILSQVRPHVSNDFKKDHLKW